MQKEEILELAKNCFEFNPQLEKLWSTGDGNFFEREDQAYNHAKSFTNGNEIPQPQLLLKVDVLGVVFEPKKEPKNEVKAEPKK